MVTERWINWHLFHLNIAVSLLWYHLLKQIIIVGMFTWTLNIHFVLTRRSHWCILAQHKSSPHYFLHERARGVSFSIFNVSLFLQRKSPVWRRWCIDARDTWSQKISASKIRLRCSRRLTSPSLESWWRLVMSPWGECKWRVWMSCSVCLSWGKIASYPYLMLSCYLVAAKVNLFLNLLYSLIDRWCNFLNNSFGKNGSYVTYSVNTFAFGHGDK